MPTMIRREIDNPAAVLTLVGGYDAVTFGWTSYGIAHLLGPPGPRGGQRTLCGRPRRATWFEREITFPLPERGPGRYYDIYPVRRWNAVCRECKAGLGAAA